MQQSSGSMGHSKHRKCDFYGTKTVKPIHRLLFVRQLNREADDLAAARKSSMRWASSIAELFRRQGTTN